MRISAPLLLTLTMSVAAVPMTIGCGGGGSNPRPVTQTLDDATITTRVKTALLNDPQLGAQQIDVSTTAGIVTLSGIVKTDAEVARAVELSKKVGGVKDVQTSLKVQP